MTRSATAGRSRPRIWRGWPSSTSASPRGSRSAATARASAGSTTSRRRRERWGWSRDRIVIIDEDQGQSGAIPYARSGFGRLVSAVARGEGGIVMSLELSRLARNDPDWHHLVYLCRWTETLIADEHGIFDPTASADRLVLGIRGQVSELERDNAVHRMVEARWNKARRGEAFTIPPAGYELDEHGALVLTPDEAVQAALARVFQKFADLGTARQVYLWWREEGLPFPVRRLAPRVHPVVWGPVSYRLILQTLHHPIYTGAYVFGRSETRRELDPESQRLVVRHVKRKEWPVLIKDHHPAYISFAQYLENQDRLRDNEVMGPRTDDSHRGAAREGRALLQGLVRCGQCGRRMHVNYGGASAARTLQYRCSRVRVLHRRAGVPARRGQADRGDWSSRRSSRPRRTRGRPPRPWPASRMRAEMRRGRADLAAADRAGGVRSAAGRAAVQRGRAGASDGRARAGTALERAARGARRAARPRRRRAGHAPPPDGGGDRPRAGPRRITSRRSGTPRRRRCATASACCAA